MSNFKKENTVKNIKNFAPYGTDPEKDKMVKSDNWKDRLEMAEEGYGLDILINDEDYNVREAVAKQGYGLDVLINDENYDVRKAVLNYLKENNLTLAEWCERNNKEIDLRKLAFSPYREVRFEAVRLGYIYKKDEIYIDSNCKFIPYGTDLKKDKMVKSNYWRSRLKIAEEGYGLNILINDEDWHVRKAVAEQGYGLDILVNDLEYWKVRKAVADQGYGLDILINDEDCDVRMAVVNQGYGLDILINDEDCDVRAAVAKQGYGLDILVNDLEYWNVRKAVLNYLKDNNLTLAEWCNQNNKEIDLKNLAYSPYPEARIAAIKSGYVYKENEIYIAPDCKFTPYGTNSEKDKMVKSDDWEDRLKMAEEGYGLDVLINDEDYNVREAVAKQGYGLDILIKDEDSLVRAEVARQGYGLGILVNDEDYDVRAAVANQGYGLDILVNDLEYWKVREAVLNYLKDNNLTLAEWCNQNNKEIDLKNLAYSPYPEARIAAIESGYVYKENEMYIAPDCKFTPYGTDPKKDKMVKSDNWRDRLEMAEEGYGLDVLINDKDWEVRRAVAKQGYGLDILINDKDLGIRIAVANQGYGLDVLINDENCDVRIAVVNQGYGLGILVNDEDYDVRAAVAEQGYGLDVLINDESWSVQEAIEDYLTSHNLTLEQWKSNQEHSKTNIINQAKNAINKGNIDIKNIANNIRSTDNILNTNINKIDEINEISESNDIYK